MDFTNNDWFIVRDIDGLINSSRALVFNSFGKKDQTYNDDINPLDLKIDQTHKEELDQILSFDESKVIVINIIKKQRHKTINKTRYLLNDDLFMQIIKSLNDRMISNLLNSLVNKGLVDTAYDAEANDFVFWVKDNENKNKKPETD
jgi:hypothetical protein